MWGVGGEGVGIDGNSFCCLSVCLWIACVKTSERLFSVQFDGCCHALEERHCSSPESVCMCVCVRVCAFMCVGVFVCSFCA